MKPGLRILLASLAVGDVADGADGSLELAGAGHECDVSLRPLRGSSATTDRRATRKPAVSFPRVGSERGTDVLELARIGYLYCRL